MSVLVDGQERHSWPVSTGLARYDTPTGSYTPFRLEKDHFSKEWDDAPMPHSIFFTNRGHAIHGSDAIQRLGSPASHGCIRLSRENAAILFDLVKEQGLEKTKVVVSGEHTTIAASKKDQVLTADRKPVSVARKKVPVRIVEREPRKRRIIASEHHAAKVGLARRGDALLCTPSTSTPSRRRSGSRSRMGHRTEAAVENKLGFIELVKNRGWRPVFSAQARLRTTRPSVRAWRVEAKA
jgi:hypothetical protein